MLCALRTGSGSGSRRRKERLRRKIISEQLGTVIQERNQVLSGEDGKHYVKVTLDEYGGEVPQVICPILCQGDAIGSVILLSRDSRGRMGETEEVLARCAAGFLGRQMEQ